MRRENPFTPSFGEIPARLAGRDQILYDVTRALESERRRPDLTTIFSGARGTGKTALLALIAEEAERRGWVAVSTTALPGMLEDIEIRARRKAAQYRRRLLDAGVIGERRRGVIGFDPPFFRDYLSEKKAEGSLGI